MAYQENIYDCGNFIDREFYFKGEYGKVHEKKFDVSRVTPEQIKRQNQRNREKRLTRTLRLNFAEGDYFLTLKYKRGVRPGVEQFRKDFKNFINKARRLYKKAGYEFKFAYRMEIGKRGGAHVHIVCNRQEGITLSDLQDKWTHGRINAQSTYYNEGGFKELAEYMLKPPDWAVVQQYSIFLEHGDRMWAFNTSRNLERPQPVKKKFKRRTMEKMILNGIRAKKGYRVIPDSIEYGVNPFNCTTYLRYTEARLKSDNSTILYYKPPSLQFQT